jgi:colicin import membrane protein
MQSTSTARPNAAVMELVRWLLLDKPRPQMAFCYLQLKPVFEESGVSLDAMMPPTWASQWASRASKVTSHAFWWFGQGGQLPSEGNLERDRMAVAERYAHAARERFGSAAAREEAREAAREAHEANKAAREAAREAAHEAAREAAREEHEAKIAAREAARVGRPEVDLTAEQALEAAKHDGLVLEPAGNKTGFSCVQYNRGKYQAKVKVLDIVLTLGTFVTPQQAALQVARHKAKGAAKAAAAGHEARVDLTAEQAMEAAKREGLVLEPAGNETGFMSVFRNKGKYQAKVQVLDIVLILGTFVTPQQAALQVARHKAKGAAKAAAGAGSGSSGKRRRS